MIAYKEDKGKAAKHFLSGLRDLIEAIMVLIYNDDKKTEYPVTYLEGIMKASAYFRSNQNKYGFIWNLHELIQATRGHTTLNDNLSMRIITECFDNLIILKEYVSDRFGISIYDEIENYEKEMDNAYYDFYSQVLELIESNYRKDEQGGKIPGRYYVNKVKPICIKSKIFYEINLSNAFDDTSKFDRITVFSKRKMHVNYAVELYAVGGNVSVFGDNNASVTIITWFRTSIRPQELNSFHKMIIGKKSTINSDWSEYRDLMNCLNDKQWTVYDLLFINDSQLKKIYENSSTHYFYDALIKARDIVKGDKPGKNIIKYICYVMHNRLINNQLENSPNNNLSGMYLKNGIIPFEKMPFAMNPIKHVPSFTNVLYSIGIEEREHELLGRFINENSNNNGILYTDVKDLDFTDVESLAEIYNNNLFSGHKYSSSIVIERGYAYVNGMQSDCISILNTIKGKANERVNGYQQSFNQWIDENPRVKQLYDDEKITYLANLFNSSKVGIITGPAGTGKTTMVKALTEFFSEHDQSFMFLAVTNTALDNLRRRVSVSGGKYRTVYQFIKKENMDVKTDILVIDECSTVSNTEMVKILNKANYNLLVLVGDENQIESVNYGSWFKLVKQIMPKYCCCELKNPYRTTNTQLLKLWRDVRNRDIAVDADLTTYGYSLDINDPSIATPFEKDEIILCLNYNGVYGINNINRFMQDSNKGKAITIRLSTFKVNDPIIFNETLRYPELYNNLKGRIIDIETDDGLIWFTISLEKAFTEMEFYSEGLEYLGVVDGRTIIKLFVRENIDDDADDEIRSELIVPFNVAYAVSIHKSQGLEYDSVKIVIANDLEDVISHNVFYTAITRAKKQLHIYWSADTQKTIVNNILKKDANNDIGIIKSLLSNKTT